MRGGEIVGDTPYATEAARVLAEARKGAVAPPSAQARESAIAALAAAMGDRGRARGRRRVVGLVGLAAAAVVLVALGVTGRRGYLTPPSGEATVVASEVGAGAL